VRKVFPRNEYPNFVCKGGTQLLLFGSRNEGRFVFPSKTKERFKLSLEEKMAYAQVIIKLEGMRGDLLKTRNRCCWEGN
jgi:hypothetical protein